MSALHKSGLVFNEKNKLMSVHGQVQFSLKTAEVGVLDCVCSQ